MLKVFEWATVMVCLIAIFSVWSFRRSVSRLTLIFSWRWALCSSIVMTIAALATAGVWAVPAGWRGAAQLMTAVTLLTPGISTLGARRPGVVPWQYFVVAPLIVVLTWPGLSQLIGTQGSEPIELSVPAMSGILLVLMMCVSTGLGTLLTIPAVLYSAGVCLWLLPLSGWISASSSWPLAAPWVLWAAVFVTRDVVDHHTTAIRNATTTSDVLDETWRLFQTLYGLVWARRFQDRVNQFAAGERWSVLLTPEGFRDAGGHSVEDAQLEQPLEAFRWMLRRFAEESWLDARLCRLR